MARLALYLTAIFLSVYACQGSDNGDLVGKSRATARNGDHNTYTHYSRDSPRTGERILATAASATATRNLRTKVVILVHGLGGTVATSLNPTVRDALLTAEDVSVIAVDWSLYAAIETLAPGAVPDIGEGIATFLQFYVSARRITLENVHLVGHGLGAHVVAYAARALTGTVARITALDPSNLIASGGVSAADAGYVEVIHTDGANSGIAAAIGTVDFYPNGGNVQTGCTAEQSECNSNRAWQFFAASVTDGKLVGNQCVAGAAISDANCRGFTLVMGNNEMSKIGSGSFFLEASDKYPYFNELNCVVACMD